MYLPFVLPGGAIPIALLNKACRFFQVQNHLGALGIVQIFWDPALTKYYLVIPEQVCNANSVKYERRLKHEADHKLICEIHTHGTMPAFFSEIDIADSRADILFYGVVGRLDLAPPEMKFAAFGNEPNSIDGQRISLIDWKNTLFV